MWHRLITDLVIGGSCFVAGIGLTVAGVWNIFRKTDM